MDDFYTEQLIKKQADSKDTLKKAGMIVLTILSVLLVFAVPVGIIFPVVMIVADVLVFSNMNVEYEYVFVNGDLDIDKIMNKSRRKRMFSVDADQMELLAPVGAVELMQYKKVRTYEYTSGKNHAEIYALIASNKGELCKVLFEPNETIIEGFFVKAPRKVIRK